jgi:8-oxo-dGTP pyrophosphatase MutT (NUDIX family)
MTAARPAPSEPTGPSGPVPLADGAPRVQVAALCLRAGEAGQEVLLVTSRGTGRWILPKGWPMAGRSLAEAAAQEAWEEAGVRGRIEEAPLGSFAAEKVTDAGDALPCRVSVFRLHVEAMEAAFPEAGQRDLQWFSPRRAAELVLEPGLSALLRAI